MVGGCLLCVVSPGAGLRPRTTAEGPTGLAHARDRTPHVSQPDLAPLNMVNLTANILVTQWLGLNVCVSLLSPQATTEQREKRSKMILFVGLGPGVGCISGEVREMVKDVIVNLINSHIFCLF